MSSSPILRALASTVSVPERFLGRGLVRVVTSLGTSRPRRGTGARSVHAVALPADLARWQALTADAALGDYLPPAGAAGGEPFRTLLANGRRSATTRAELIALLAGAIPFGSTRSRELWLYVVDEPTSPARGVIAKLAPTVPGAPKLLYKSIAAFAVATALEAVQHEDDDARTAEIGAGVRARLTAPGVAEQEAVRSAFERASALCDLILGGDATVRRAARKLAARPLDVPHPPESSELAGRTRKRRAATATRGATPIALGALLEAFFRETEAEVRVHLSAQSASADAVVRGAAALLAEAMNGASSARPSAAARELARRRNLALRAAKTEERDADAFGASLHRTRRIADAIDAMPRPTDPLATSEARDEALLALAELGDRAVVPSLVARAVTGDASAVDMLGALRDERAAGPLEEILSGEPARYRQLEPVVVRALGAIGARSSPDVLRALLADNPMPSWREGLERGALVRELVAALGALEDARAGEALTHVLEARSQEYRAVVPTAAWAIGRIHHQPALDALTQRLRSPKEPPTCEAIWAIGRIGEAHPTSRPRALEALDGLSGLEPGAEMVRLVALAKMADGSKRAPRLLDLRGALERALWEPGFRQDETSRRRAWALRSLEELATAKATSANREDADAFFLGHEAVRYFVTRDDHRVRRAAERAFAAWNVPVPTTRRYYRFVLDDLEARGGVDALHHALKDPLGVYRHNIATRLAERGHPSSVRPLAEATARLFGEPATSAYEYDDAPSHLVAFVRAVAKLNRPEGNDVLIDGLRSGNHQVRAVVAENAPEDERFVPELMAMLGDPRSFLRSRAERTLAVLGARVGAAPRASRGVEV